jgi:hypothetical protein
LSLAASSDTKEKAPKARNRRIKRPKDQTKVKDSSGEKRDFENRSNSNFSNEKRNSKRKSEKIYAQKMNLARFSTSKNG